MGEGFPRPRGAPRSSETRAAPVDSETDGAGSPPPEVHAAPATATATATATASRHRRRARDRVLTRRCYGAVRVHAPRRRERRRSSAANVATAPANAVSPTICHAAIQPSVGVGVVPVRSFAITRGPAAGWSTATTGPAAVTAAVASPWPAPPPTTTAPTMPGWNVHTYGYTPGRVKR